MELDPISTYLVFATSWKALKTFYMTGPAPKSSRAGDVIETGPDGKRYVGNKIMPIFALPLFADAIYLAALAIHTAMNTKTLEDTIIRNPPKKKTLEDSIRN